MEGLSALGEKRGSATMKADVRAEIFAFCKSALRPYILHRFVGVLLRAGLLCTVCTLRLKDLTQLGLRAEEHMEPCGWGKARGPRWGF